MLNLRRAFVGGCAWLLSVLLSIATPVYAAGYQDPDGAFSLPDLGEWSYRGEASRGVTLICSAAPCESLPQGEREFCSIAVEQSDQVGWTDELLTKAVGRSVFEEASVGFASVAEMTLDDDPTPAQAGPTLWMEGFYSGHALADRTPLRAAMWITGKGPVTVSLACVFLQDKWEAFSASVLPVREGFRWSNPG